MFNPNVPHALKKETLPKDLIISIPSCVNVY